MIEEFAADLDDEDVGFWFTPLHAKSTGLPLTVWIRESCGMTCAPYLRIGPDAGPIRDLAESAVMTVASEPRLLDGHLPSGARIVIEKWISQNAKTLIDHWSGAIDSMALCETLCRTDGAPVLRRRGVGQP